MKPRRALGLFLFAAGCFGLGLGAARLGGWSAPAAAPSFALPPDLPPDLPPAVGTEPRIYIDAGAVELYDGSLSIHPPPPPDVEPR